MFKDVVFRDMTPCGSSKKDRRFGVTCRLHLQGNETESSQLAARICLTTDCEERLLQRHFHGNVYPYFEVVVVDGPLPRRMCLD
jgi:hypothetical protein